MKHIKHAYEISLLPGNHGVWLFVKKDGVLLFEQAGLTLDQALEWIAGTLRRCEGP